MEHVTVNDSGAIKLFRAVVLQAFVDATRPLPKPPPAEAPGWKKLHPRTLKDGTVLSTRQEVWDYFRNRKINRDRFTRDSARNWLTHDGEDFRQICELALWEPDYIRHGAEKLSAKGWVKYRRSPSANDSGAAIAPIPG